MFPFPEKDSRPRRAAPLEAGLLFAAAALVLPAGAAAQTEFQFQYGRLLNPFSGEETTTRILTIQQAAFWSHGESFFFLDILGDDLGDGFNDRTIYGEWYPTLSLGKLAGRTVGGGPLRDIQLIGGLNMETDTDIVKVLPGVRASWDVPGFFFVNTDFMVAFDTDGGIVPANDPVFVFDVSWGASFDLGSQTFSFAGHAEYTGPTTNAAGAAQSAWFFTQPQLTWDVSKALNGEGNNLFLGIEYQFWGNKLGTSRTENTVQLLVVWRL